MRYYSLLLLLTFFLTSCEEQNSIYADMKIDHAVKLLEEHGWVDTPVPYDSGEWLNESYSDPKGDLVIVHYNEETQLINHIYFQSGRGGESLQINVTSFNLKTKDYQE